MIWRPSICLEFQMKCLVFCHDDNWRLYDYNDYNHLLGSLGTTLSIRFMDSADSHCQEIVFFVSCFCRSLCCNQPSDILLKCAVRNTFCMCRNKDTHCWLKDLETSRVSLSPDSLSCQTPLNKDLSPSCSFLCHLLLRPTFLWEFALSWFEPGLTLRQITNEQTLPFSLSHPEAGTHACWLLWLSWLVCTTYRRCLPWPQQAWICTKKQNSFSANLEAQIRRHRFRPIWTNLDKLIGSISDQSACLYLGQSQTWLLLCKLHSSDCVGLSRRERDLIWDLMASMCFSTGSIQIKPIVLQIYLGFLSL